MRENPERWDISVYASFGGCSRLESTSPAELLLPAVTISNLGTVNGFYRTATVGCLESNFHVITAGNMNDPRLSQTAVTAIRLTEWQSTRIASSVGCCQLRVSLRRRPYRSGRTSTGHTRRDCLHPRARTRYTTMTTTDLNEKLRVGVFRTGLSTHTAGRNYSNHSPVFPSRSPGYVDSYRFKCPRNYVRQYQ